MEKVQEQRMVIKNITVTVPPFVVEKTVKRYTCSLCRKSFSNKKYAQTHIQKCKLDPYSRSCATCAFESRDEFIRFCKKQLIPEGSLAFDCPGWEKR